MTETRIRPATTADRPALESFMAALQEHERALHDSRLPGSAMAADHLAYLLGEVAQCQGCCLIAERGGSPIGFLIGVVERQAGRYLAGGYDAMGLITDVYLVEEARGGDALDALLAAAEAHFRALGIGRLLLFHLEANAPAARAYAKRGFAPYERVLVKRIG